jgi:hypothetical protein
MARISRARRPGPCRGGLRRCAGGRLVCPRRDPLPEPRPDPAEPRPLLEEGADRLPPEDALGVRDLDGPAAVRLAMLLRLLGSHTNPMHQLSLICLSAFGG